jgi:hypothetical protein
VEHEQLPLQTLDERATTEAKVAYGVAGLVDEHGEKDWPTLVDKIYVIVSEAVVDLPGERAKVAISKDRIISQVFPKLPGPADWIDQSDAELAEKAYGKISADVSRVLRLTDDGEVQSRLNGDRGMLLCKTKKAPQSYYVTRNLKCITEDYAEPSAKRVKSALDNHAALLALAMERLPEHATKFNRAFESSAKVAIESGRSKVRGTLDAVKNDDSGNGDET